MAGTNHEGQHRVTLPSWWTVLIADPDASTGDRLATRWADAGAAITACQDGASALFEAGQRAPDLVLLAAVLPQVSIDVVVKVLREHLTMPILLAVGPGDAELLGDRLGQALIAGASEVIARPYTEGRGLAQLDAQVARLRAQREVEVVLSVGRLQIDVARFEARVDQRSLDLTVREFHILYYLMRNYDRAVTAEEIKDAVWGSDGGKITANTLAVHIGRLRKSLGGAGQITHIRRVGYRLNVD